MSQEAIATVVKMMESLPNEVQDRVAEHLRDYIEELQDELRWDELFEQTQASLVTGARQAKQEIAEGKATPMDEEQL